MRIDDFTPERCFEQLEKCGYSCDGGPLEGNLAYGQLKSCLSKLQSQLSTLEREKAELKLTLAASRKTRKQLEAEKN